MESDFEQRVPESIRLQDPRFLLGVRLERVLPVLDATDQVLELAERDLAEAFGVEGKDNLATHFQAGTAFDVVCNSKEPEGGKICVTSLYVRVRFVFYPLIP